MKKGISINELAAEISRQKDAMADYVIDPSRLLMDTMTDTPKLRVLDENGKDRINPLDIGVYAHRQIAGYLNIPQAYYDLMLDKNPDLLGINVNDWLYRTSEAFNVMVENAVSALSVVAGIALEIFDLLVGAATLLADNWSWLSPIIYGVAAALAVYYGWQLAVNAIQAISKGIHMAMAVAQMIHLAATGALTAATAAETAAQYGLNAALYACPTNFHTSRIEFANGLFFKL